MLERRAALLASSIDKIEQWLDLPSAGRVGRPNPTRRYPQHASLGSSVAGVLAHVLLGARFVQRLRPAAWFRPKHLIDVLAVRSRRDRCEHEAAHSEWIHPERSFDSRARLRCD